MKIVIINSSPRRNGNTAKLCDAFSKGVIATITNPDVTTFFQVIVKNQKIYNTHQKILLFSMMGKIS